uniref:Isoeugenol synthase 1 n=1 Tax=Petunia hybrida TaxID=4102 RepID=IGS1_PETHY|nr:RecName: Full=Isoeugenol synthase 1; Short=PhIGS1 [Petunia x hybrida]ABD17322.1 isoeugenol synthase 1 [Petunia x hybrida]
MTTGKGKILILGATGYLGKYMVKASISLGHPTYAYVMPLKKNSDDSKLQLLKEFESLGVTIFYGELSEHDKLVAVFKEVDIVISTLAVPQYLEQLKVIEAIKEAGNIKRFVPSEFGNEVDRVRALPRFQAVLDNKKKIRRATEAAGIPFTFVSANSLTAYFVDYLLHPRQKSEQVTIYGSGDAKAVLNYEEDVAAYTIKAADDPRAANRVLIIKPPKNIVSQLDLVSSWEKTTGSTLKMTHISEQEIIKLSESINFPENIHASILHNIFIAGAQLSFELTQDHDLEASELYPNYNYTSVDEYLKICLVNPPKPKLATYAQPST